MLSAPRSDAHTRPTREPFGSPAISWTSSTYAGSDQHRHDRDAAGGEDLGLVGMEGRRGHDVVVEALEPLGQVVEERALGLDQPGELVDEPLGIEAGVGVRAFGEQHPDERSRSLAFRGGGEGGRGQLVGREAGVGRAAEHLGHDPGQRLGATPLWRAIGDVGPGTVATHDVAGVGQTSIDRADGVGVHSQCRTKLAHGRQPRAGQQPARVDLVGELPEDLGRDRDVGVALDIERATGRTTAGQTGTYRRLTSPASPTYRSTWPSAL